MTVTHWRYNIGTEDGLSGWGVFVLGSDGFFAAVTDFGNYAYIWSSLGGTGFREFILGVDSDYVRRKLDSSMEFNLNATVDSFKIGICESRRSRCISAINARRWWNELEELGDEHDWIDWMRTTDLPGAWDHGETRTPPAAIMAFVERLLPRLKARIADQLLAESTP